MLHMLRITLWALIGLATAHAQTGTGMLEVKRSTNVYAEPTKTSEVIHEFTVGPEQGIVTITLLEDAKTKGYYRIRIPGRPEAEGWIYKTYVRRHDGPSNHPKYVAYDRKLYRHWTDQDRNCRDTREEVLIRDAKGKLQFRDDNECKVVSGRWLDPYTATDLTDPGEIDVDHLVPLKNAHNAGGWAWSPDRRREYANFMTDRYHLLPVDKSENRSKADKGPEKYLPPNASYHCDYIKHWSRVKRDWGLEMTDAEWMTVQRIRKACRK